MEYLRKCNLKQFFCLFKNNKKISCDVSVKEFFEYFKNFFENVKIIIYDNISDDYEILLCYEELDVCILELEVEKVILKLKSNKSNVEDGVINEFFLKCKEVMIFILCRFFNNIFDFGFYLDNWLKGCIVLIFK